MRKTWRFSFYGRDYLVEGDTIFDAMLEFQIYSDAKLDADDLAFSRFDQIDELLITQLDN